jgi:hypothetical protein
MKLATLAVVASLGIASAAHADPAVAVPVVPVAPIGAPGARVAAGMPARPHGELRQALLERFDRDRDGRLEPQERRRAIRALRRLARRLEAHERLDHRAARTQNLVRRFDTNHDGVVTPDEMPPGVARKLRRLERRSREDHNDKGARDRNGWVDGADQ